jgi:hypothetical protein
MGQIPLLIKKCLGRHLAFCMHTSRVSCWVSIPLSCGDILDSFAHDSITTL